MARIRSIHSGMGESKDISKLTIAARYFFALLWCHLDDEGRTEWLPKKLVGAMFAHDEDVTSMTLNSWLDECVKVGVLVRYEIDGYTYISCPKFKVYQKPQKPQASKIPPPSIPIQDDYNTTTVVVSTTNSTGVGEGVGEGIRSKEKELGEGAGEEEVLDTSRPVLAVVTGQVESSGKFRKPTVDEVKDLMRDRGWLQVHFERESEAFWSYYDSNGWKVGRNPMRSWQSAVTNWGNRMIERGIDPKRSPGNSGSGGYKLKTSLELAAEVFGS